MMPVIVILLNTIFFLFINFLRFRYTHHINKSIFVISGTLFSVVNAAVIGFEHAVWLGLIVLFVLAASYKWIGSFSGALILIAIYNMVELYPNDLLFITSGYLLFSFSTAGIFHYFNLQNYRLNRWQNFFYKQSKNLHVLREVSLALQSTLKLDKLMHIFLTAVTAGYGLGFNRAFIFIQSDESSNSFSGRLAIGPLSVEEGHVIWENVVSQKLTLRDFIKLQREAEMNDHELNQMIRSYQIHINETHQLFHFVLTEKEPIIVEDNVLDSDDLLQSIKDRFSMKQFAIIPLLTRGKVIGLMMIDNIVDQKPIEYEDLDNIMPLATQGAMAIENAMLYEKTESMAIEDALTKLKNKRFLDRMFPHLQESAESNKTDLTALVMDIDHFKVFNDTHGHLLGNEVLIQMGQILSDAVNDEDIVCRFGGEEFVILLPKAGIDKGVQVAEKIRETIRSYSFKGMEAQPFGRITASIGVASYPETTTKCEQLIHLADEAVYEAKNLGRDRTVCFYEKKSEVCR
ncbi:GGDEF domain-containing protein [Salipaludibacillus daqingensis]|uniref:GGDEF domain-containing protein n=1 Tax=Salipaludibacillus daqingensis TaxID=3041001 RepID=UPI00247428CD|nr:sensor domain-containing diguanylate cyclase [Salipaludibacillus daqingensis]